MARKRNQSKLHVVSSPPGRKDITRQPQAKEDSNLHMDEDLGPQTSGLSADDLLTVEEAAKELRIGRTTTYNLLKSGELCSLTIAGKRFIKRAEVARYIRVRTSQSLPPRKK